MRDETTVTIDAPPEAVWAVLMDVESWPELTDSINSVKKLDPGPLRVGSRARIRQPKLPRAVWTVTELAENFRFVWVARGPGLLTTAAHEVVPTDGGSLLRLTIEQSGLLGGVVGRVAGDLTRRYLAMEAAGTKRRAEGAR